MVMITEADSIIVVDVFTFVIFGYSHYFILGVLTSGVFLSINHS